MRRFSDDSSPLPEHFRVLARSASSVLVGGRNAVYNLSLADLSEHAEGVSVVTLPPYIAAS